MSSQVKAWCPGQIGGRVPVMESLSSSSGPRRKRRRIFELRHDAARLVSTPVGRTSSCKLRRTSPYMIWSHRTSPGGSCTLTGTCGRTHMHARMIRMHMLSCSLDVHACIVYECLIMYHCVYKCDVLLRMLAVKTAEIDCRRHCHSIGFLHACPPGIADLHELVRVEAVAPAPVAQDGSRDLAGGGRLRCPRRTQAKTSTGSRALRSANVCLAKTRETSAAGFSSPRGTAAGSQRRRRACGGCPRRGPPPGAIRNCGPTLSHEHWSRRICLGDRLPNGRTQDVRVSPPLSLSLSVSLPLHRHSVGASLSAVHNSTSMKGTTVLDLK